LTSRPRGPLALRSEPAQRHIGDALDKGRRLAAIPGERQIEMARGDLLDELAVARDASFDAHFRMRAGEAPQHLRQHGFAEIFLEAEPDPAFELDSAHCADRFVIELEQAAGIGEERFAAVRQRQPAPRFAHQRDAGLLLELLQLRADGGSGAPKPLRCPGEGAHLHSGGEAAQRIHVEIGEAHYTILNFRTINPE